MFVPFEIRVRSAGSDSKIGMPTAMQTLAFM